jgi:hypothetical protein
MLGFRRSDPLYQTKQLLLARIRPQAFVEDLQGAVEVLRLEKPPRLAPDPLALPIPVFRAPLIAGIVEQIAQLALLRKLTAQLFQTGDRFGELAFLQALLAGGDVRLKLPPRSIFLPLQVQPVNELLDLRRAGILAGKAIE